MATPKEYAYYIKGNKIAVVERNTAFDNDPNSRNYGPGTKDIQWESPLTSVTDALEIEYTHVPDFTLNTSSTVQVNKFYVNGWTVVDGYLTFLKGVNNGVTNWGNAPYSAAGVDEYINVEGSSRWNGLHKIKARDDKGKLTTYTKVNEELPVVSAGVGTEIDFAAVSGGKAKISGDQDENIFLNAHFVVGDYIWAESVSTDPNTGWPGMWKVGEVDSPVALEQNNAIYVTENIRTRLGQSNVTGAGFDTEIVETATVANPGNNLDDNNAVIRKCYRDFCSVQTDITVMQDEDFQLDLPRYLNRAVVFYLKAKQLEDVMEVEGAEYFMAKFRKLVEEDNSNKKGKHRVMQGHWNLL